MQDEPKNDVNLNVLGTGCATSCGTGCAALLILIIVTAIIGVQVARQGSGLVMLGFLLGMVGNLIVGYVTARAARQAGAAVNSHVLIIGGLSMILGLYGLLSPQKGANALSIPTQGVAQLFGIIGWILTIPLMLLGASWNADDPD